MKNIWYDVKTKLTFVWKDFSVTEKILVSCVAGLVIAFLFAHVT